MQTTLLFIPGSASISHHFLFYKIPLKKVIGLDCTVICCVLLLNSVYEKLFYCNVPTSSCVIFKYEKTGKNIYFTTYGQRHFLLNGCLPDSKAYAGEV